MRTPPRRVVLAIGVALGLLVPIAPDPALALGNAGLHVTKTVSFSAVSPVLSLSFSVDKGAAIPGDVLTYSGAVTNTGASLGFKGTFMADPHADTAATVASYFDVVETCAQGCGNGMGNPHWVPFVGFAATQAGYTPVETAPVTTGMTLTATAVPAAGVTYPSSGDPILGTQIATFSSAAWNYQTSISLTPAQITRLSDPAQVQALRSVVHFEVTLRNPSAAQPWTDQVLITNPLQATAGAALANNVTVTVTPPTGSPVTFTSSTVPGFASLAPGASVAFKTTSQVAVIAPKGAGEADSAYLARLAAAENAALRAAATASATAAGWTINAGRASAVTTEHLPILGITKLGPATIDAGTTEANPLTLTNSGGAPASGLAISDTVPMGTPGTVLGIPTTLAPGASGSAQAINLYPYAGNDPVDFVDPSGGTLAEYAARLASAIEQSAGTAIKACEELANVQLVLGGLQAVASVKGQLGEDLTRQAYGSLGAETSKPTIPELGPVTGKPRLPDLHVGPNDLAEVKNVKYQAYTKQLKDSIALAEQRGGKLTLFTRASTKLSKPLQVAASRGLLRVVACLPG